MSDLTAMFEHTCCMAYPEGVCGKEATRFVKWKHKLGNGIWWLCGRCYRLYMQNKKQDGPGLLMESEE